MRTIINLMIQDTKLLLRNSLFWIVTATLILIVVTIQFLIPEGNTDISQSIVSYNLSGNFSTIQSMQSSEEVYEMVRKNNSIGFIEENGEITVIHSGLPQQSINALVLTLFGTSSETELPKEFIRPIQNKIPMNLRLVPIFICFEALVLGFLMGGILMLSEKEQKTLQVFRISPAKTIQYIIAKTILLSAWGTVYSLVITVFTVGVAFNWILFILLAFISSAMFTLLGLVITVFFKDLNSWFLSAILVLAVNMLSTIGYSNPSYSPLWMRFIPSYHIIFGFEEVLFSTGKDLSGLFLMVSLETFAIFLIANLILHSRLFQRTRSMK